MRWLQARRPPHLGDGAGQRAADGIGQPQYRVYRVLPAPHPHAKDATHDHHHGNDPGHVLDVGAVHVAEGHGRVVVVAGIVAPRKDALGTWRQLVADACAHLGDGVVVTRCGVVVVMIVVVGRGGAFGESSCL